MGVWGGGGMGDVYKIKDGNIEEKMICRNGVCIVLDI